MIRKTKDSIRIVDRGGRPVLMLTAKTAPSTVFTDPTDCLAVSATNGAVLSKRDAKAVHAWIGKVLAR